MDYEIKTIKNQTSFKNIFHKFFKNNRGFIKTKIGNFEIYFLYYRDGIVAVRVHPDVPINKKCTIFTRVKGNVISAEGFFYGRSGRDLVYFIPQYMQIMTCHRQEQRFNISEKRNKLLFVRNIISDYMIRFTLNLEGKKIQKIKERIQSKEILPFEYYKIFFNDRENADQRMRFVHKTRDFLMIPDRTMEPDKNETSYLKFYNNFIYKNDTFLVKRPKYISEIIYPLMFKNKIPFGYIQANGYKPFSPSHLTIVKRATRLVEDMIKESNLISAVKKDFMISNVSKNGVAIVFKDKQLLPFYRENNLTMFDLILPTNQESTIMSDVKHVEIMKNENIKIGFHILEMDSASNSNYKKIIKTVTGQ